jgi:hypothetical protein
MISIGREEGEKKFLITWKKFHERLLKTVYNAPDWHGNKERYLHLTFFL